MANATPQNVFNVQLTRSQLELLDKMLDQEISALESGYAHPNPKLLKRTCSTIWEHLRPSPEEKQLRFETWVKSCIDRRTAGDALLGSAQC
jgi:hypothetical protein